MKIACLPYFNANWLEGNLELFGQFEIVLCRVVVKYFTNRSMYQKKRLSFQDFWVYYLHQTYLSFYKVFPVVIHLESFSLSGLA